TASSWPSERTTPRSRADSVFELEARIRESPMGDRIRPTGSGERLRVRCGGPGDDLDGIARGDLAAFHRAHVDAAKVPMASPGVRTTPVTTIDPCDASFGFHSDTLRALAPAARCPGHDQLDAPPVPRAARQRVESFLQLLEPSIPERVSDGLGVDPWRAERHLLLQLRLRWIMRLAFRSGKLRVRWPDRARGCYREDRRIRVTDRPLDAPIPRGTTSCRRIRRKRPSASFRTSTRTSTSLTSPPTWTSCPTP